MLYFTLSQSRKERFLFLGKEPLTCFAPRDCDKHWKLQVSGFLRWRRHGNEDGKCAVCSEKHDVLNVDHSHETGNVRGLLCGNCNRAIGIMKDDAELLRKAITYLGG